MSKTVTDMYMNLYAFKWSQILKEIKGIKSLNSIIGMIMFLAKIFLFCEKLKTIRIGAAIAIVPYADTGLPGRHWTSRALLIRNCTRQTSVLQHWKADY